MIHQFSCAYPPQQNSVVERKHQDLLNVARAFLFQSNVPLQYWSDCILTAVFLMNHLLSPLLDNVIPYELLTNRKFESNFLRSFGCLCYVSTLQKDRHKFSPRAGKCVFLGYSSGYKRYKVLHLDTNLVSVSRNVIFHETIFPFLSDVISPVSPDIFTHTILPLYTPAAIDHDHCPALVTIPPIVTSPASHASGSHSSSDSSFASASPSSAIHSSPSSITNLEIVPSVAPTLSLPNVRPKRSTKPPGYLSDFHCSFTQASSSASSTKPITTPYPLSFVLTYNDLNLPYQSFVFSIFVETEPKTFKQAMISVRWTTAMNGTWCYRGHEHLEHCLLTPW